MILHHTAAAAPTTKISNPVEIPVMIGGIPGHLYLPHEASAAATVADGGIILAPATVGAGVIAQVEVLATVPRLFIDFRRQRQSRTLSRSLAMGRRRGRATKMLMESFPT